MHPSSLYRSQAADEALALAATRGFGVVTAQLEGLFGAHVPFVLAGEDTLHLHLHRGNPLAKRGTQQDIDVMVIVSLCDAYVSPDWYNMGPDQVPTWVYGAVHIHGTLSALPDEALEPMLADLSAEFENRLDKTPWTLAKMSDKPKQALMRAIQPFEVKVSAVEATDKFAQNKPAEALGHLGQHISSSLGANLGMVEQRIEAHRKAKS